MKVCMVVLQYPYSQARVWRFAGVLAEPCDSDVSSVTSGRHAEAKGRVDILCLRDPGQPPRGESDGVRYFTIPVNRGDPGLRSRTVLGGRLFRYVSAFVLFSLWLLKLHLANGYDIIQVFNMPDFLIFTAALPKLLGARLVLDICDPMPELYLSSSDQSPVRSASSPAPALCLGASAGVSTPGKGAGKERSGILLRLLRAQERLSCAFADAVTTANPYFEENLVARGVPSSKVTVVNYSPDPRLFDRHAHTNTGPRAGNHTVCNGSQPFTLIYPGTIAARYGLDVAVRALPLLVSRIPGLRLVIIGPDSPHADELAALATRLGVGSHVEFRPRVLIDAMPAEIAGADVGIYPARPDPHMSIAMPLKVLEYAMMGIPIVASRLKVLQETLGEEAILYFDPGDVEGFARCVLELYVSPERRAALVRQADAALARHPWETDRRAYLNVLARLSKAPLARQKGLA